MAQKVITTLVDDLDGTAIEDGKGETVKFAIDGSEYEIDLTSDNATVLRESLKPFIGAGRPIKRGRRTSTVSTRNSAENLSAIREWAARNGHEVSSRGRIPQRVQDAFKEASK
ncbi:histone-like nucleoid-structuring protein Lsr2 [Plantibacter sp. YIM 135249]|uniref:histone-like nucleoid-structuring protein Lsr2 n=1 Tax=Plantibacter sp. YIM 135249 TaxID=3423918 RepID=UPI003D349202